MVDFSSSFCGKVYVRGSPWRSCHGRRDVVEISQTAHFSTALPSGRPRWEQSTTDLQPCDGTHPVPGPKGDLAQHPSKKLVVKAKRTTSLNKRSMTSFHFKNTETNHYSFIHWPKILLLAPLNHEFNSCLIQAILDGGQCCIDTLGVGDHARVLRERCDVIESIED